METILVVWMIVLSVFTFNHDKDIKDLKTKCDNAEAISSSNVIVLNKVKKDVNGLNYSMNKDIHDILKLDKNQQLELQKQKLLIIELLERNEEVSEDVSKIENKLRKVKQDL